MNIVKALLPFVIAAATTVASPTIVQAAEYLEINGVKGGSLDAAHKDWFDLTGWSWSGSQRYNGAVEHVGPVNLSLLTVTLTAVPKLYLGVLDGTQYSSMTIESTSSAVIANAPFVFNKITLTNARIVSIHSDSTDAQSQTMTLSFQKIDQAYKYLTLNGSSGVGPSFCYDFSEPNGACE